MCSSSKFIFLFIICGVIALDIEQDGSIDLTNSLDASITNTIIGALRKLREETSDGPHSLFGIQRITFSPGQYELNIEAYLGWHGASICHLRLHEETDSWLDINCGKMRWRLALAQQKGSVGMNSWIGLNDSQMTKLSTRIAHALAQIQAVRGDPPYLLPVQLQSAQRQQTPDTIRYIVGARLGIPAQTCELEIVERINGYKRIIVTCDHLHVVADSMR